MSKYAVIAIGYNRPLSMQRLLESLEKAYYEDDDVTLIVSIDNSGTDAVEICANAFQWTHGAKRVVTYPERQGLRKHILQCGNFLRDYDAVAVFEDDIVAAPGFYSYMKAAVEKYQDDDRIAGISLYNHLWNVNVDTPFEPSPSPYDAYFLQFAQSWGQIWMKKQWFAFADWYQENCGEAIESEDLPAFVCGWPKTSWLKYHIKYCVERNKYFVYPYFSLSSCYSDAGEHTSYQTTYLHVPTLYGVKKNYQLPSLSDKDSVVYDVFFERDFRYVAQFDMDDSVCVDLYGSKKNVHRFRYLISMQVLPYKAVKSYGMQLKPHENNVIYDVGGNDIYLYDLTKADMAAGRKKDATKEFRYRFRVYGNTKQMIGCVWEKLASKIRKR